MGPEWSSPLTYIFSNLIKQSLYNQLLVGTESHLLLRYCGRHEDFRIFVQESCLLKYNTQPIEDCGSLPTCQVSDRCDQTVAVCPHVRFLTDVISLEAEDTTGV